MTGLGERLLRAFVVPPDPGPGPTRIVQPPPGIDDTIALVARPEHAERAARAVAAAALQRSRAATVLVCRWGPPGYALPSAAGAGRGPAARVAGRLRAHGVEAGATGRTVWAPLPEDPQACVEALHHACRLADPGPLVTVLAGERPAALDALLAGADVLVIAHGPGEDAVVAELVWERLRRQGQRGGLLAAGGRTGALAGAACRRAAARLLEDGAGQAADQRIGASAHARA